VLGRRASASDRGLAAGAPAPLTLCLVGASAPLIAGWRPSGQRHWQRAGRRSASDSGLAAGAPAPL